MTYFDNAMLRYALGERRDRLADDEIRAQMQRLYDGAYRAVESSPLAAVWLFMNFGFRGETVQASRPVPASWLSKDGTRLLLEVIGDLDLDGRDLLDVSCGRGGSLWVLRELFSPRRLSGVDLSTVAIEAAGRVLGQRAATLLVGDAECLPVEDGCADVVLNVESASHYPRLDRFFGEVARVLRPGGALLFADQLRGDQLPEICDRLASVGLTLERSADLTAGVLAARRAAAASPLFKTVSAERAEFLALPQSQRYRDLCDGRLCYRALRCRAPTP